MGKDYRQFTARDLLDESRASLSNVNVNRDEAMLSRLMKEHMLTPVQIAAGLKLFWREHPTVSKDIPTFARRVDDWLIEDDLLAAYELVHFRTREPTPGFVYVYMDYQNGGTEGDARGVRAYREARVKLEKYIDEHFARFAAKRS